MVGRRSYVIVLFPTLLNSSRADGTNDAVVVYSHLMQLLYPQMLSPRRFVSEVSVDEMIVPFFGEECPLKAAFHR